MPQPIARSRRGFTLVELLVVIGIIALLISILLPSLNKAKRQANLIYCQSQLRQIWQGAVMYANENKGVLPAGRVDGDVNRSVYPETVTYYNYSTKWPYDWTDSVSLLMGKKPHATFAGVPIEKAEVFRDLDTVEVADGNPWPYTRMPVQHYTGNSRLFVPLTRGDKDLDATPPGNNKKYRQRVLSSVKRPSDTMAIWDGGQQLGTQGNNAAAISDNIDQYRTGYAHCMYYPAVDTWYGPANYRNLLALGTQYGNSVADVKRANVDAAPVSFNPVNLMRFRHMNNDTGNFVFADGHAESRKVATVTVMDIVIKRQ